jgi:predicted MFS family arabinose efflux permease
VLAVLVGMIGLGHSSVWLTALLAFASGLPTAPFIGGLNLLTARIAAESAHVRAFSAMQAASTVMSAVGAAIGGAAIDRFGPASVSVPAALLLAVSARLSVIDGDPATGTGRRARARLVS